MAICNLRRHLVSKNVTIKDKPRKNDEHSQASRSTPLITAPGGTLMQEDHHLFQDSLSYTVLKPVLKTKQK